MSALSPPSPYSQAKAEAVAGAAGAMVAPVCWPAVVPGSSTGFGALREAGPTVRKAGPISMKRLELFRLAAPKDSGAHRYPGTVTDVLPPAPAPLPTTLAEASEAGRTLIMGIINVTPDSFSDGGRWDTTDLAVAHGRQLRAQGADLLDVGGESTRPGAARITPATEQERIIPVVRALAASGAVVSVDTVHAATAEAAVGAGAVIVNDVSGGLADPAMHRVVADTGVVYICQHWRGDPGTMDRLTDYSALGGVVDGVETELRERLDELDAAGAGLRQVVIDPGLGFAKTHAQSWRLLAATERLRVDLGLPVLIGPSRKRFLAAAVPGSAAADPIARDAATAATTALAALAGAWAVRVHEVPANRDAVRTASLWKEHR